MWGTKEYFAPEVVDQAYGPQADVWALGCVLYEMLTGEQAFPVREHDTESKFYGRISRGEYDINKYVLLPPFTCLEVRCALRAYQPLDLLGLALV